MAIFHKRDVRLPLLTQLCQIDAANPVEIEILYARAGGYKEPPEDPSGGDFVVTELTEWLGADAKSLLEIIRPIMDALADDSAVDVELIRKFHHEQMIVQAYWPFVETESLPVHRLQPLPQEGPVAARSLRMRPDDVDDLRLKALGDLMDVFIQQKSVNRCPECSNPFVVSRPERNGGLQVFCSHRCGARASVRNKRAANRERPDDAKKLVD